MTSVRQSRTRCEIESDKGERETKVRMKKAISEE